MPTYSSPAYRPAIYTFLAGLLIPASGAWYLAKHATLLTTDQKANYLFHQPVFLLLCVIPVLLAITVYVSRNKVQKNYLSALQQSTQQLEQLEKNAQFVKEIGTGNFSAEINLKENDELGKALQQMRNNLLQTNQKEEDAKWINLGSSEVSSILRSHSKINELGEELVSYLCKKIKVVQAAFYVVIYEEGKAPTIKLTNTYAYSRKKYLNTEFKPGEGLVGQAVIEADRLYRTEIPEDYITIKSGLLGDKKPAAILIQPLITNEKVFGAIELASLQPLPALHLNFMEAINDIIARTIFNISVNEENLVRLQQSKIMTEELSTQRTLLLENAREMELAQQELERTNTELEEKVTEVNNARNRQQALLERASEIITIIEANGIIRYQSPSVKRILGYHPDVLIGKAISNHVHLEDLPILEEHFESVKDKNLSTETFQLRYLQQSGDIIWTECSLSNLLHDPSIKGLVMNSRDITLKRQAEEEQRMRAKMQSLSENSLDLIARVDLEGKIIYINPVIETLTHKKVSEFTNSLLSDNASFPEELKTEFLLKLKSASNNDNVLTTQIKLASQNGYQYFQISAVREFDSNNELETILFITHNITDQKLSEEIILEKNRKITESINYSHRIQNALMPTEQTLQALIPNSFILFKPKDIVSGDFPFLYQQKHILTIAAVDCTGHGVPGALMSFIGHFTLNQIMSETVNRNAGQILDELHYRVQATLKQDTGSSDAKDGMDVALCRINLNTLEMEYAGAHRPAYVIKANEFIELKGEKYPVAGMHYKTRKPFTNNVVVLSKNDLIVFNTDGLPDQFGGSDGKQKFMSKKVREIIEANKTKNMPELKNTFNQEFENWKGKNKQMDDVLMIGIKL